MNNVRFEKEFNTRFINTEQDILKYGGKNIPEPESYALYKICFLLTLYQVKRLGYSIPETHQMPERDISQAEKGIECLSKTWKIMFTISQK